MPRSDPLLRLLIASLIVLLIGGWVAFFTDHRPSLTAGTKTFAQENRKAYGPTIPQQECFTDKIPVLMYHHIRSCPEGGGCGTRGSIEYGLSVEPVLFERQMKTLKESGYRSVLPRELAAGNVPCKAFVLTFDDGYDDNTSVLPVLERYGFHAGFSIIIDRVDTAGYMGASDIVRLIDSGHEILSHSVSHPNLVILPGDELREELERSKRALESAFKISVDGLVYPSGGYDERVEHAAQVAGYRMALTTVGGWASIGKDAFAMRRMRMSNTANADLKEILR